MTNKFCANAHRIRKLAHQIHNSLQRNPNTHTPDPMYSTYWFISASLRLDFIHSTHTVTPLRNPVSTYTFGSWLVRSPTKPSSPAGFSANGLHVHDSIPSGLLPSRDCTRAPNERVYVHAACISPPVSVLISHQFLLWRTRGPGRQQAILVAASRCLDLEDVASALFSSRGSCRSPSRAFFHCIFSHHFFLSSSFRVWWIRVTVPQCTLFDRSSNPVITVICIWVTLRTWDYDHGMPPYW